MDFGFVGVHRTPCGACVGQLVTRRGHKGGDSGGVAVVGSGVHQAFHVSGNQRAVPHGAELHSGFGTRCRACGAEHIAAIHDHLHRAAGFLGEYHGERLKIDGGFTAKAAADLGGGDLDLT